MRNRLSRRRHEGYAIQLLSDENGTLQPVYRAQSVDINTDFSIEQLSEIGNEGFVQLLDNTPVVTATVSGNQTAKDVASGVNALQWLALLANGDTVGSDRNEVVGIGKGVEFHNGNIHHPISKDRVDLGDVGEVIFTDAGATLIDGYAAKFTNERRTELKSVTFWVAETNTGTDGEIQVQLWSSTGTVPNAMVDAALRYKRVTGSFGGGSSNPDGFGAVTDLGSNGVLLTEMSATFDNYFVAEFDDYIMDKNTEYWLVFLQTDAAYDNSLGSDTIVIAAETVGSGGNSANRSSGTWAADATLNINYSLNATERLRDFDNKAFGIGDIGTTPEVRIPVSTDLFLPVKGIGNDLDRIQYYANMFTTSVGLTFDVGGVAAWEVGLEGDNETKFDMSRRNVSSGSITVAAGNSELAGSGTVVIGGATGVSADSVTIATNVDDVFLVTLNGEIVEQATTVAEFQNKDGCNESVPRWAVHDDIDSATSGEENKVYFPPSTLVTNDIVRVVYEPEASSDWDSYRLTSSPGDQGGIFKGELDIRMITDTRLPRVVEGLDVADSGTGSIVTINPGACYLRMDNIVDDSEIPQPTGVLELFRLTTAVNLTLDTAAEWSAIAASVDPFGNLEFVVFDGASQSAVEAAVTTASDGVTSAALGEFYLILAAVEKTAGPDITQIVDLREFHCNTLSLIQSASMSADLSREVIMELGNRKVVARNLVTPVPVTTEFTAKDSDQEIYALIQDPELRNTVSPASTTTFAASTAVNSADDWDAATLGDDDVPARVGDILFARGSLGIITAISTSTATVNNGNGWFGGTPPDGSKVEVKNGLLKATETADYIGIQVNLYQSDDRKEADKQVIFETIDNRPASTSVAIAVGGDGELNVSLQSDNLRAFTVA